MSVTAPAKPTASPFWKWVMRVSVVITLLLFLTPTFFVLKYFALDQRREALLARQDSLVWRSDPQNPDYLPAEAQTASDIFVQAARPSDGLHVAAIREMGKTLRLPGMGWKRPLECLSAKATLAELAANSTEPDVKIAAAQELQAIARRGAVIRR